MYPKYFALFESRMISSSESFSSLRAVADSLLNLSRQKQPPSVSIRVRSSEAVLTAVISSAFIDYAM